jgi:hypothetical protein
MDLLAALQEWFALACDSDWEHTYGIKVETLDNPGWVLRVDLCDTPLEHRHFDPIKIERTESDWVFCKVENNAFTGFGGVRNLIEIIQVFANWASANHVA